MRPEDSQTADIGQNAMGVMRGSCVSTARGEGTGRRHRIGEVETCPTLNIGRNERLEGTP
jgi:hypothetical protein